MLVCIRTYIQINLCIVKLKVNAMIKQTICKSAEQLIILDNK